MRVQALPQGSTERRLAALCSAIVIIGEEQYACDDLEAQRYYQAILTELRALRTELIEAVEASP